MRKLRAPTRPARALDRPAPFASLLHAEIGSYGCLIFSAKCTDSTIGSFGVCKSLASNRVSSPNPHSKPQSGKRTGSRTRASDPAASGLALVLPGTHRAALRRNRNRRDATVHSKFLECRHIALLKIGPLGDSLIGLLL